MSKGLEFIEKLGFKFAGKWELEENKNGKIKPHLIETKKELKKIIYAFVVMSGEVKYVGKATTLKQRMQNYRSNIGERQYTNKRINDEILKSGEDVLVYVLSNDDANANKKEFLSLMTPIESLEEWIIGKLKQVSEAEWNIQGGKNE
jgi:hypothetical protein